MRTRLALLLPLLAASCAAAPPSPAFDPVGLTEAELIARLGLPTRSHEAPGGRRFLAWETLRPTPLVTPGIGLGVARFGGGWGSGVALGTGLGLSFGGGGATTACTATYELVEGRVTGVTRQGEGC
jgi:hypothetical protein